MNLCTHNMRVCISVSCYCWGSLTVSNEYYILRYSDKHVCKLFYRLYRVISNSPVLRSCVSAELTKLFICMPHRISWQAVSLNARGRSLQRLIVLSFSLYDSGEPCGLHRRSWGIGRLSQPLPCSTRQERESTATLGGSSKRVRPSLRHQTSTTSPCSTEAETGSAGWGHTRPEHLIEKLVTFQQIYKCINIYFAQDTTCFVTAPPSVLLSHIHTLHEL